MRFSIKAPRSGQAIVLILAVLVVLLAALLWDSDVHTLVTRKIKAQNAGDAAALAAARWQANALNLVGELNLAHIQALENRDYASVEAITSLQARVAFAGPLAAMAAANAAAKVNGITNNADFTAEIQEHATKAARYGVSVGDEPAIPEPFPGAWGEYSAALRDIASRGVAAAPDNARLYFDPDEDHILLQKDFYQSVAARDWCWFFIFHGAGGHQTILDVFTGHNWFDPLPDPTPSRQYNSEFFGIGVEPHRMSLGSRTLLADYLRFKIDHVTTNSLDADQIWYVFSGRTWGDHWPGMSEDDDDPLPLAGPVRPEYDYAGADAVVRLHAAASLLSFGGDGSREIVWTAAAKPFGFIKDEREERLRPNAFGLVLPVFGDIRLIPLDAATSGGVGSFDLGWSRHRREHVPEYLDHGSAALVASCEYCACIRLFEDPDFRAQGSEWLRLHSNRCSPMMYGNQRGGGSRRGH